MGFNFVTAVTSTLVRGLEKSVDVGTAVVKKADSFLDNPLGKKIMSSAGASFFGDATGEQQQQGRRQFASLDYEPGQTQAVGQMTPLENARFLRAVEGLTSRPINTDVKLQRILDDNTVRQTTRRRAAASPGSTSVKGRTLAPKAMSTTATTTRTV